MIVKGSGKSSGQCDIPQFNFLNASLCCQTSVHVNNQVSIFVQVVCERYNGGGIISLILNTEVSTVPH